MHRKSTKVPPYFKGRLLYLPPEPKLKAQRIRVAAIASLFVGFSEGFWSNNE